MSKRPYWNFWKVVFAGWLIQYPRRFFAVFRFPFFLLTGIGIVAIYNMLTS